MAKKTNIKEITNEEFRLLYHQVVTMLGAGIRNVEITPETLQTLLDVVIQEYSSKISDWIINQQWGSLQGLPNSTTDLTFALTSKTIDFERSFSHAYSKFTGISTDGIDELKKDYIVISANTQDYIIPKGRLVSHVLWKIPPQLGNGIGIGSGLNNLNVVGMGGYNGVGGGVGNEIMTLLPSFAMYQTTMDLKMKKLITQSDLTYTMSKKRDGSTVLHLYPIPGSSDEISGFDGKHFEGSQVWYNYFDTEGMTPEDIAACKEANDDIIHTPNDVNLKNLPWQRLNDSSKSRVRRLLIAEAKNYLAMTRGKFSGALMGANGKEMKADYTMLLEQAEKEKATVYEDLNNFLKTMTNRTMMEDKAAIAQSLNQVLKFSVPGQQIFYF